MPHFEVTYTYTFFVEAGSEDVAMDKAEDLAVKEFGTNTVGAMASWISELSPEEAAACGFEVKQ